jgi:hypothetical protein
VLRVEDGHRHPHLGKEAAVGYCPKLLLDSGLAGIELDGDIAKADLVVTAIGAIDFQTPRGKVPTEVAMPRPAGRSPRGGLGRAA